METRRYLRMSKKGQTTTEFALILPFFMLILLGILDFSQIFFYQYSLQYSVQVAGRFATTGQLYKDETSRTASIKRKLQDNCLLPVPDQSILITSWPGNTGATATNPNLDAGIAEDKIRIEAYWYVGMVTPVANFLPPDLLTESGEYVAKGYANFRNEPSQAFTENPK